MHIGVGFEQFHIKESKHTYTPRVVSRVQFLGA